MRLNKNDNYLIKRIEGAEDREAELFSIITEYGLNQEQVSGIQRELEEKGINVRQDEEVKNPKTGDSPCPKSTSILTPTT